MADPDRIAAALRYQQEQNPADPLESFRSLAGLKSAYERRVQPIINNAMQTFSTGGAVGDLLRSYGEAAAPGNAAALQGMGIPFKGPMTAPREEGFSSGENFQAMGEPQQQFAGQLLGDPMNLAQPAGARLANALKFAKPDAMRMVKDMSMGASSRMIEAPLGRIPENSTDIKKLSDMFQNAGRRAGYELSVDHSAISPSTYLSYFKEGLDPFSLRLSNHADKHASGAFKVDPTASTFEQAMAAAKDAGYPTSLNTRFENQAAKQLSIRQQQAEIEKQTRESTFNDFRDKLPKYEGARLDREANSYAVYPDSGGVIRLLKKNVPVEIKTNPNSQLIVDYILRDK